VQNLKSELDNVETRFSDVQDSCGLGPLPPRSARPRHSASDKGCAAILRYKSKLPLPTLLSTCAKLMTPAECNRCLGMPQDKPTQPGH
jgi:hypothetical protein